MALAPPVISLPFIHEKGVDQTPPASPTDVHPKMSNTFDFSVAEQVVLEMGIPDMIIHMVKAFRLLEHKTDFSDARQLFEAAESLLSSPQEQARIAKKLFEAEQAKRGEGGQSRDLLAGKAAGESGSIPSGEVSVGPSAEMQKALAEAKPALDDKAAVDGRAAVGDRAQLEKRVRRLAQENHKLRQRKMCCKCKEVDLAISGVTFLPCGHFITCETCCEAFEECPACGKGIMGTVRTFLS